MKVIAGIMQRNGYPVPQPTIDMLAQAMVARHAGSVACWSAGPVALLQVAPPSVAMPPLPQVAVARLDNRAELLAELFPAGRPAEPPDDAALLRGLYERRGRNCAAQVLGDFAFALWDQREQSLFCARDQFGVQALYYYLSDDLFVFASDLQVLLAIDGVPRRLNQDRARAYLAGAMLDATETFYAGIVRLPAAHWMAVSPQGVTIRRYWELDPQREIRLGSDAAYGEAFRAIFAEAVRCRLATTEPAGALLSGGLDSSAIVCMAQQLGRPDLPIISAKFPSLPACDETSYIEAVLAQGRHQVRNIRGDEAAPWSGSSPWWAHVAEPHHGMGIGLCWHLLAAAKAQGIGVLLDGNGGDEVVSHGDDYLLQLAITRQWPALLRESWAVARNTDTSCITLIRRLGIDVVLVPALRNLYRRLRRKPLKGRPQVNALHMRAITAAVQPLGLETLTQAAAAHGIALRFPFWDRRLVEFCLALPPEQKLRHGMGRFVMRTAMEGIMPDSVRLRRGKVDFLPNLVQGIGRYERERLEAVQQSDFVAAEIDPAMVRRTGQRLLDPAQRVTPQEVAFLWRSLSYTLWLRESGIDSGDAPQAYGQGAFMKALGLSGTT